MTVHQTVPKGWSLTGKNGAMDGKIFSLEITNVSIGTDPTTCNIVYPADTLGIAQLHCRLIWKDNGWLVVSFGDSGTWLNDNLLKNGQAVPINPSDTLSLANSGNNFILKYNLVLTPQDQSETNQSKRSGNLSKESWKGSSTPPPPPEEDTLKNIKEKFFSFKGRLNREPYILRTLALTLLSSVNWAILSYIDTIPANQLNNLGIGIVIALLIFWVICVVASISLGTRRLHDTNHSGWWWLTGFVPFLNFYTIYLLYFKKGTEGDNRFGSDPLAQGRT